MAYLSVPTQWRGERLCLSPCQGEIERGFPFGLRGIAPILTFLKAREGTRTLPLSGSQTAPEGKFRGLPMSRPPRCSLGETNPCR